VGLRLDFDEEPSGSPLLTTTLRSYRWLGRLPDGLVVLTARTHVSQLPLLFERHCCSPRPLGGLAHLRKIATKRLFVELIQLVVVTRDHHLNSAALAGPILARLRPSVVAVLFQDCEAVDPPRWR